MPPSRPEIAREMGLRHQGGVDAHLNALAKKGFLKVFPNVERGLKLLREGAPVFDPEELPDVAASDPIVAEEREPPRLHDFDSFVERFESSRTTSCACGATRSTGRGFAPGTSWRYGANPKRTTATWWWPASGRKLRSSACGASTTNASSSSPRARTRTHRSIPINPQTEDVEIVGVIVGAVVGAKRRDANE